MHSLLIAAALLATPEAATPPLPSSAAKFLADDVQTGTLLFSEGDCLAVRAFTGSPYTHVATVVVAADDNVYVYDSTAGVGTRRQTLANYLTTQCPDVVHVSNPHEPLDERRQRLLVEKLEAELGRPYGLKHHLSGKRAEGIHCAEYATDALMTAELIRADRPSKVSPASLLEGVQQGGLYDTPFTVEMQLAPIPEPVAKNWCHGLWLDTKTCTVACWSKVAGWCLCK